MAFFIIDEDTGAVLCPDNIYWCDLTEDEMEEALMSPRRAVEYAKEKGERIDFSGLEDDQHQSPSKGEEP
jgi:hypothetical protein